MLKQAAYKHHGSSTGLCGPPCAAPAKDLQRWRLSFACRLGWARPAWLGDFYIPEDSLPGQVGVFGEGSQESPSSATSYGSVKEIRRCLQNWRSWHCARTRQIGVGRHSARSSPKHMAVPRRCFYKLQAKHGIEPSGHYLEHFL